MKIRWKHIVSSALALALCLSLAACGNSDDVAGEDWRTSGMVAASGTITHDGESVDVLVTVSESSAAFYRDLPEQVLFDSVSFPMNIPDAEQAFNAIFLEDLDGDGESDVLVSFIHENGDETELVWIWDPVERYVFREDLSTVAISGGAYDGALLPADEIQSGEPRDEKSRTFSSNSQRSHILRTSSRSIRLILSSIVSLAVWLKWTRTI